MQAGEPAATVYGRAEAIFRLAGAAAAGGGGAGVWADIEKPHVLIRWYEAASPRHPGGHIYRAKSAGIPHITALAAPKAGAPASAKRSLLSDWSILDVDDVVAIRWIVADFDAKDHFWVLQEPGYDNVPCARGSDSE